MIVEVALDHLEHLVPERLDSLPLSCSYNIRAMMDFIRHRWGHSCDYHSPAGVDEFATLYGVVRKRWPPTT